MRLVVVTVDVDVLAKRVAALVRVVAPPGGPWTEGGLSNDRLRRVVRAAVTMLSDEQRRALVITASEPQLDDMPLMRRAGPETWVLVELAMGPVYDRVWHLLETFSPESLLIDPDGLVEVLAGVAEAVATTDECVADPAMVLGLVVGVLAEIDDRRSADLARSAGPTPEGTLAADLAEFAGPLEVGVTLRVLATLGAG